MQQHEDPCTWSRALSLLWRSAARAPSAARPFESISHPSGRRGLACPRQLAVRIAAVNVTSWSLHGVAAHGGLGDGIARALALALGLPLELVVRLLGLYEAPAREHVEEVFAGADAAMMTRRFLPNSRA